MRLNSIILFFLLILSNSIFSTDITINGSKINFGEKDAQEINLNKDWHFCSGDNSEWANPKFNDSKWDTVSLPLSIGELIPFKYNGNVWLRSTFTITRKQTSTPFYFTVRQFGASEIYLDGKLINQFGKVGNSESNEELFNPYNTPIPFIIDSVGIHHIAVRFSNHSILVDDESQAEMDAFSLDIVDSKSALSKQTLRFYKEIIVSIAIGIFLTLSIINFILFFFYKRDRSNLYYSIFSTAIAFTFAISAINNTCNSSFSQLLLNQANEVFLFVSNFFLMALVYSFAYAKNPKRLKILLGVCTLGVCLVFINFNLAQIISNVINLYCIIDIIIVLLRLYKTKYDPTGKKRKRFWIILAGVFILACLSLFFNTVIFAVTMGILILMIALPIASMIFIVPLYMTIRHARNFSITNENLEKQLIQVKELSEKAIFQEQEKKKILESQNERLEQMVDERTAELAEKNHEIKDSINYALRIQKAILTSKEEINEGLKKCFILFKPKDIVSGDFYFYSKIENKVVIAAADCTGHGVPGALMSMIGSEKLMSTTKENTSPSVILNSLNKGIKSSLRQTDKEESTKDGMDIALVSIDLTTNKVSYAGANRPIWIIRASTNSAAKEVEEIKATKKAIGGFTDDEQHFEQHELQLNPGDTFYLFTDGYADQFGHSGKKLMTKKFRELLIEIQSMPMDEQEIYLNNFIETWKKDTEQVDDILVIGVRI